MRALIYKMLMSTFQLKYFAPEWLKQLEKDLDEDENRKIYGGGQKDIIFSGAMSSPSPRQYTQKLFFAEPTGNDSET